MKSAHVSTVIAAAPETVYAFVADPDHLPRWASGLANGDVTRRGNDLVVPSPMGEVVVTFAPRNPFGIVDHDVHLPDGSVVRNPMRIIDHPHGAEIVFTVRQLDLDDEQFERDAATVAADLETLRDLLERLGDQVEQQD